MTDAQWYYAEDGEQQGPVSFAEMRRLVSTKRVQPDDLVWCDGMDDWLPAGEVAELQVATQKPKPVRKAPAIEPKAEEPKPAAAGPKAAVTQRSKSKAEAPPVQESPPVQEATPVQEAPAEEPLPDLGNLEREDEPDEVDKLAESLFAPPKFPARRPRYERESRREAEREPEIIRETTREVVVMENADAQLSGGALFLQLICWALCGLAVLAAAIVCGIRWLSAGVDSSSTLLLGVAVGSYVLGRSAQRCLEILAAMKQK